MPWSESKRAARFRSSQVLYQQMGKCTHPTTADMFNILAALFKRTSLKDEDPPSYEEVCGGSARSSPVGPAGQDADAEDRGRGGEEEDRVIAMGQKPSGYHRSKVSLTWVLKGINAAGRPAPFHQIERQRDEDSDRSRGRIAGRRNERYQICERVEPARYEDSEYYECERTKKHTRRKRRPKQAYFGYQIEDIDQFLAEASIDRPGNIPVVVIHPSVLYQTQSGECQTEMDLSLGMVVNAVFKNRQWLYVQTPHGDEGYVLCSSCLPLGILPPVRSREKPVSPGNARWESCSDLYHRLGDNLTDTEKEVSRRGSRSECGRARSAMKFSDCASLTSERAFDRLYLKAKAVRGKTTDLENLEAELERFYSGEKGSASAVAIGYGYL